MTDAAETIYCRNCSHVALSHRGRHRPSVRAFTCGECVECYPVRQPALPPTQAQTGNPDWVMLGYPENGGYVVLASKDLDRAQLTAILGRSDDASTATRPRVRVQAVELAAIMRTYVRVEGASYGDALARLMDVWSADETPELTS